MQMYIPVDDSQVPLLEQTDKACAVSVAVAISCQAIPIGQTLIEQSAPECWVSQVHLRNKQIKKY